MNLENWLAFCSIALIAAAIPGPAILLVTTHSLQFGTLRSLFTVAGNITGLFILSACSILGLSALVKLSSTAFTAIKIVGALYLLYMGIKIWRSGVNLNNIKNQKQVASNFWNLYSQGIMISLTNPKAIIFTSALFPQFINISKPLLPQFLILVITLMACSFLCLSLYSVLSQKLKSGSQQYISGSIVGKIIGAIFIGVSGALAISIKK